MAKAELLIEASPAEVFAYLADLTRHGEWAQHELAVERTAAGSMGVGATFISRGRQLGQRLEDRLTITDYVPGERLTFEAAGREGRWRHVFELRPAAGGTQVTKIMEPLAPFWPLRLIMPAVNIGLSRRLRQDLERIKLRLESGRG